MKYYSFVLFASLSTLLTACGEAEPFRETFFKNRPCEAVQFYCLEDNRENPMQLPSSPYMITAQDRARIEQAETLKMYRNFIQMVEILYPGFWQGVKDESEQLEWVAKVDKMIKKYDPMRTEGRLQAAVHLCAIIGVDFERNPKFQFVVEKLKHIEFDTFALLIDYLRFEVLQKDYDIGGNQYNNWSLRGIRDGSLPPVTRHIPDFDKEWKPHNPAENRYYIYRKTVLKEVK